MNCECHTLWDIIHSFTYSTVCLMTHPQPVPKWVLHTVWPSASSFKSQYPLVSLRSSSNCLRLLPCLPVTSILPSVFPPLTCFRRQLLCKIWKMWPIKLALLLFIVCRIFFSTLTLCNMSLFLIRQVQLISILLQQNPSKFSRYFWSTFWSVQVSTPNKAIIQMQHFIVSSLNFKSNLQVKSFFLLLNAAFAMAILDFISCVHLA